MSVGNILINKEGLLRHALQEFLQGEKAWERCKEKQLKEKAEKEEATETPSPPSEHPFGAQDLE